MLLATLTNCVSRDLIDKFSVEFVHFNSKLNRMKLIQAMYQGQRASNDMLPYFGRLTATLEAAMKGFAAPLLEVCGKLCCVSAQHPQLRPSLSACVACACMPSCSHYAVSSCTS
jgi:hypothetical protein